MYLLQILFWQSSHHDHKAPDALLRQSASKARSDLPVAWDCVHLHHGHPWHLILPDEEDDVFWQYYGGPQDQYGGWGWASYSLGLGLWTISVDKVVLVIVILIQCCLEVRGYRLLGEACSTVYDSEPRQSYC